MIYAQFPWSCACIRCWRNVIVNIMKCVPILDGILVANEIVDAARKKNIELILFNVDFDKAYDFEK